MMHREELCKSLMSIEHPDKVAEILSALDTANRVWTFQLLHQGVAPKEIADELDVTRSALQPYLTDFKDADLVEVEGKQYVFTERGEKIYQLLEEVDKLHQDLSDLQQFLIDNPDVVPEEVLDEIEKRRRENQG